MWIRKYSPEAFSDLKKLDNAVAVQVLKGIRKLCQNPLPSPDGYGKPLGK